MQIPADIPEVKIAGSRVVGVDFQVLCEVLCEEGVVAGHLKSPPLEDVVGYEVVPSRGHLSAGPR